MKTRNVLILLIVLFCLWLTLKVGKHNNETGGFYDCNRLIRFHVIANSDRQRDQDVKYRVRDALIAFLRPKLEKVTSYEEARRTLLNNRSEIARIARETLREAGLDNSVNVMIGRFTFPARAYGGVVLPAGEYEAVRVVLGEGKGANWWCVLFPPLCFVDIAGYDVDKMSNSGKEVKETTAAGEPVSLRFRLLDWIRNESGHLAKIISS